LPNYAFFCSTSAKPFFRPDRSSIAPPCRAAKKPNLFKPIFGAYFKNFANGKVADDA